ncbi:MAG TPA: lysylphosphatidylglycerol synthase transmembrane domain-containing protein, partial [Gammaproteobacteria bacterium]|nr:lysylphosphatidylglycerol synthase transmembrane domain-containing protein [Gammaproteobacteria bacterium]
MQQITKHFFTLLRVSLALGMLYYLALSGSIDWSSFTGLAKDWRYTVLAILLFFLATVVQAWRLQMLINAQDLNLSFLASIRLTFIGLFFNTYLPGATGGDLVKIYYASKGNPGCRTEVITILLLDRFIGLFSLLTLPLILAPLFPQLIASQTALQVLLATSLAIALCIGVVAILGARTDLANSRIMHWIERKATIGSRISRMLHTLHSYRNHKSALLKALASSYFLQLLMVMVSLAIAQATNPDGASLKMIVLIPLGFLANSLPITPGGLGVG